MKGIKHTRAGSPRAPRFFGRTPGAHSTFSLHREREKDGNDIEPTRGHNRQERLPRSFLWIAGGILALALTLVGFYLLSRTQSGSRITQFRGLGRVAQPRRVEGLSAPTRFVGDTYHVSDVGAVPARSAVLFIDSTRPNSVFWMNLNENGQQAGDIKELPLGATVHNPKGITQLGSRYLIVGDLATPKDSIELLTFTLNTDTQSIAQVQSLTGLRKFLLENVPELISWSKQTGERGGLIIEAVALSLDPQAPRLLLGFRRPLINGNALVVSLRLVNPGAPITRENLELAEPNAYQVPLSGQGIRGMRYDNHLNSYLIISGASDDVQNDSFTLWEWNGEINARGYEEPQQLIHLDGGMRPGGLTRVKIAEREYVFIAGEENSYATLEYAGN